MKKSLVALAALSVVTGVAHADVTLYGILDAGVLAESHAGDFSSTFVTGVAPNGGPYVKSGTAVGMVNGGEKQSRWGIKGSEDMGDGNSAFFNLESAISVGTGQLSTSGLAGAKPTGVGTAPGAPANMVVDTSLNGQLFGRNAYIGLANKELGTVTLGRQTSLELDIITATAGGYDPVNAQMFSPINFSGFYGGGGTTDSARVDNAVKYTKLFGENLTMNAMYALGGIAGSNSARDTMELGLGYELNRFGVEFAAQEARDTTAESAGPAGNTIQAQYLNLKSVTLALRYQLTDPLSLKAGYQRIQWTTPTDESAMTGITQLYGYTINPTGNSMFLGQKNYNVFWLGGNYQATPKLKFSAGFYDVALLPGSYGSTAYTVGTAALGASSVANNAFGADRYTSFLVDYDLSKQTNLYFGYMHDQKGGPAEVGVAPTGGYESYDTVGGGMVVRF